MEKIGNKEDEKRQFLPKNSDAATFEEAISATSFGKYNIMLILMAIPAGWASVFETTTMSYIFPAAQCDLNLSLSNKGSLNAITYLGMISSAFIWGFLCDTLGRKKLLVVGYFLDTIFVVISSLSQSFLLLMITKFLGGFIINGPFAALTSYLSEFHAAKHRARVQMVVGIIFSAGITLLPIIAGIILPLDIEMVLFDYLKINSWNILLLISALSPLMGGIFFSFLPESPKFLMTTGRNDEALRILRKVYSSNTGNPPEMYPIKSLVDETKSNDNMTANRSTMQALNEGWQQMVPLFSSPLLQNILLVCVLQLVIMMSLNTLRLWLPQLFQAINDYEYRHNGTTADICTMIDVIRPKNITTNAKCEVNTNVRVYINTSLIACTTLIGYIVAGYIINILGKKKLLFILGTLAGISGSAIYFAQNTTITLILSSLFITLSSVSINVVLAVVVDLFPTTLRTMTVSLTMMVGRIGAMSGNLLFPILLKMGCAPPFFTIGGLILVSAFGSLLLPNTNMKALQ